MRLNLFIAKSLAGGDKNSVSGRRNTIIAGISIAISMVIILFAVSISDGFSKEIEREVTGYIGDIVITAPGLEPSNSQYPICITDERLDSIRGIKGVASVQGAAYITGVMKWSDEIEGIVLKGVNESPKFHLSGDSIAISSKLAEILNLSIGDRPFLYFVRESVKVRRYTVGEIFEVRVEDIDKGLVLCSIDNVKALLDWDQCEYSSVEIVKSGNERLRREDLQLDGNYEIKSPKDIMPHLFDWLALLDYNVLIVIILMTIVAGFNMISGLLIILFEKISMIGLLKSLGMRNSSIHKIFLIRALSIVIKGMAIGNVIALILLSIQSYFKIITLDASNYFVNHIPVSINLLKILTIDIAAIVVIAVILFIPALFISRVEPDKSLRQK